MKPTHKELLLAYATLVKDIEGSCSQYSIWGCERAGKKLYDHAILLRRAGYKSRCTDEYIEEYESDE